MDKVYDQKPSTVHDRIIAWIRPGTRVLDVGCGTGRIGAWLSEKMGCSVVGVELCEEAARQAEERCKLVLVGNISDERLWKEIEAQGPFDHIVMADVLEHLPAPEAVLRRSLDWLSPDGRAIISVPNVAHWSIRWSLLLGRWNYEPRGIMDDSHLRFYTRVTFAKLVAEGGYRIESMSAVFRRPAPLDFVAAKLRLLRVKHTILDTPLLHALPNLYAYQFIADCSPVHSSTE